MARDQNLLPRREGAVDAAPGFGQLGFEARDVLRGVDAPVLGKLAVLLDLVLEFEQRFFEWKNVCSHGWTFIR